MLEYPIYKHLIQFSNLVDKSGNLMIDPNSGLPTNMGATQNTKLPVASGEGATDAKTGEENKADDEEEHEGGERDLAYEGGGGDTQNTQTAKNATGNGAPANSS